MFTARDRLVIDKLSVAKKLADRFQPKDRPAIPSNGAIAKALTMIDAGGNVGIAI